MTGDTTGDTSIEGRAMPVHRKRKVLALFFLAPLVGEYLLGNIPITQIAAVVVLAPMYGGGAVLVRETTRRLGGRWPTILLLAAAYALVEEALIDQMVFNPGYLDLDSFADMARIPALDASAQLVAASLTLHTVWSIGVPIALVEAFDDEPARPWLRTRGLIGIALLFAAGSVLLGIDQAGSEHFVGTPLQFGVSALAVVVLIGAGVLVARRRPPSPRRPGVVPRPRTVGLFGFAATTLYFGGSLADYPGIWQWLVLVGWLALVVAAAWTCLRWSARAGWSADHRLALAGGALCTYLWGGVVDGVFLDVSWRVSLLGNVLFGLAAVLLLRAALGASTRYVEPRTGGT